MKRIKNDSYRKSLQVMIVAAIIISLLISIYLANNKIGKNNEIEKNRLIQERVKNTPGLIHYHTLQRPHHQLHYVSSSPTNVNDKSEKTTQKQSVVFIHGTPGSWGTFARYFEEVEFKQDFRLYSIDRPGWGKSGYPGKRFPVHLGSQSALIAPILEDIWKANNQQKVILVGHSLGGSLVPKLAVDYPHFVKSVIILAGDLDPELSEARWFNTVVDWIPKFLLPKIWSNSNDEVLAIRPSLESLQEAFANITMPIIVMQGTDDDLVRPGSAEKAPDIFKSSDLEVIFLEGASHIIDLTHVDDVKKAIYKINDKRINIE